MTRRTYLIIQTLGLLVLLAGLAVSLWWPRPTAAAANRSGFQFLVRMLLTFVPWVMLLVLLGETVETWIILRRFARKQAEADRAELPPNSDVAS